MGSLSKAAEYWNYTQSAVSQIVVSVENDLGLTLLNRSHAGVSLTSDGERLYPYVCDIALSHRRLSDKAFEILGIGDGNIRVGTFSSISCQLLPSIIGRFKARYPNIHLELLTGDYTKIERWICHGTADLGFVNLPTRRDLKVVPVVSDRMLALLPENHPMAHLERIPLRLFEAEPVIMMQEGAQQEALDIFRKNNIKPRLEYRADDDYTIMAMVEAGLGISLLPELVLKRSCYNVAIRDIDPGFCRSIAVAVRKNPAPSVAAQAFLKFISAGDVCNP